MHQLEANAAFPRAKGRLTRAGRSMPSQSRRVSARGSGFDANSSRYAVTTVTTFFPYARSCSVIGNTHDLTLSSMTVTAEVYTLTEGAGQVRSWSCQY